MSNNKKPSSEANIRNSLRPFFRAKKKKPYWKQLQAIRVETPLIDYSVIYGIVESSPNYPFAGLGNTYPSDCKEVPNGKLHGLKPLALNRELALQVGRLNYHAEKLSFALNSLGEIVRDLCDSNYSSAETKILEHKSKYGNSLAILKKEMFLGLNEGGLRGLSKRFSKLSSEAEGRVWSVMCKVAYDMLDPAYPPDSALRSWYLFARSRPDTSDWYTRLLKDEVIDYSERDTDIASACLRYGSLSLIDLALQLWKKKAVYPTEERIQNIFSRLDERVMNALSSNFTNAKLPIPKAYITGEGGVSDIDLYRVSYCFSEVREVAQWRVRLTSFLTGFMPHQSILGDDKIYASFKDAAEAIAAEPRGHSEILKSLDEANETIASSKSEIIRRPYLESGVIAASLRQMPTVGVEDGAALVNLLAKYDNIHTYITQEVLDSLLALNVSEGNPLLSFMLREMIYRKSRTADNEMERRLAFMQLFNGRSDKRVSSYLRETCSDNADLFEFLTKVCSRSFLERLFMLMTSVKDVLEEQLHIAEWKLEIYPTERPEIIEEIGSLKRELENLEARSDLDSTRVHVDEEGLREWFSNTHSGNVTRYIQTVLAEGPNYEPVPMLLANSNKERGHGEDEDFSNDAKIGSEFLLVSIMAATLKAFAADRSFGLDAYLSRRIRHGTLSGLVITPIARVLKRMTEAVNTSAPLSEGEDESINHFAVEWRKYLTAELDHIRREVIQIKGSEHPEGLIRASWETAGNIQHLDAMIVRLRNRVIETGGRIDIFSEIYAYCWDCIEPDLAQLRLYLARGFAPRAMTHLQGLYADLAESQSKLAYDFVRELGEVLNSRIHDVVGWFIRPVFRRDEYSLKVLVTSTLSIVRELDDNYSFAESVSIDGDPVLNRGGFDVFGDVLFVLIGNAAKHGKRDGNITIKAEPYEGLKKFISLTVKSEVDNSQELERALARIDAVRQADTSMIDQAAVGEGFSGVRKLIGLLNKIKSGHVSLYYIPSPDDLTIEFKVILPTEILSSRGAA